MCIYLWSYHSYVHKKKSSNKMTLGKKTKQLKQQQQQGVKNQYSLGPQRVHKIYVYFWVLQNVTVRTQNVHIKCYRAYIKFTYIFGSYVHRACQNFKWPRNYEEMVRMQWPRPSRLQRLWSFSSNSLGASLLCSGLGPSCACCCTPCRRQAILAGPGTTYVWMLTRGFSHL